LVFIRHARALGFTLDQVRALLTCAKVKSITEQHIADIKRKVNDLNRLERILCDMVAQRHSDERSACPILDALGRTDI
jgi:MerR family transcriptional regulator, mercuric resistance operon regulatory protein